MGLFKKDPKPESKPQPPQPEIRTESESVTANLTEKMLLVELDGDSAYLDRAELKGMEDRIRITSRGLVIADVTKRGKAYKELEPYLGRNATGLAIDAKQGDYGLYYRVKLKFETTRITIQ